MTVHRFPLPGPSTEGAGTSAAAQPARSPRARVLIRRSWVDAVDTQAEHDAVGTDDTAAARAVAVERVCDRRAA